MRTRERRAEADPALAPAGPSAAPGIPPATPSGGAQGRRGGLAAGGLLSGGRRRDAGRGA